MHQFLYVAYAFSDHLQYIVGIKVVTVNPVVVMSSASLNSSKLTICLFNVIKVMTVCKLLAIKQINQQLWLSTQHNTC